MMSHRDFKLKVSKRFRNVVSGFFALIWCDLRSFAVRGSHLMGNYALQNECCITWAKTAKLCHTETEN